MELHHRTFAVDAYVVQIHDDNSPIATKTCYHSMYDSNTLSLGCEFAGYLNVVPTKNTCRKASETLRIETRNVTLFWQSLHRGRLASSFPSIVSSSGRLATRIKARRHTTVLFNLKPYAYIYPRLGVHLPPCRSARSLLKVFGTRLAPVPWYRVRSLPGGRGSLRGLRRATGARYLTYRHHNHGRVLDIAYRTLFFPRF